jgi:hypothetical protein
VHAPFPAFVVQLYRENLVAQSVPAGLLKMLCAIRCKMVQLQVFSMISGINGSENLK